MVMELHRSNVLRLETEELLKECRLDLQHVKWHASAHEYLANINTVLQDLSKSIPIATSSTCALPLQADKLPASRMSLGDAPLHVSLEQNVGITTRQGNAKELPLLQCHIVLPNSLFNTKDYLHHRYFSVSLLYSCVDGNDCSSCVAPKSCSPHSHYRHYNRNET